MQEGIFCQGKEHCGVTQRVYNHGFLGAGAGRYSSLPLQGENRGDSAVDGPFGRNHHLNLASDLLTEANPSIWCVGQVLRSLAGMVPHRLGSLSGLWKREGV